MLSYIPQPIPFYTNTARQLFRQDYAGNVPHFQNIVLLFSDGGIPPSFEMRVPRFQVKRAKTGAALSSFVVKNLAGTTVLTLPTTGFELADLDTAGDYEAVIWNTLWVAGTGTTITANNYYYFQFTDGTNTWYSESFYVILVDNNTTDFPTDGCTDVIRLKWALDCDIQGQNPDGTPGGLVSSSFSGFEMYIEADPGKPEYQYEEEGETDANGVFLPDMRRVQKRWKIEFIGDERAADAVNMVPLFDTITMYYPNGDNIVFGQVNVDTEWISSTNARLTLTCSTDYGIRQGCCPE